MKNAFKSQSCGTCGQTLDYALPLSRGMALMLLALYTRVRQKGLNKVHVGDEMVVDARSYPSYREMVADGRITYKMEGNMSTLHRHGLAVQADEPGWWLVTPKGANFLRGLEVPRVAVVDKRSGHKAYYLNEATDRTTFTKLLKKETPFWNIPPLESDEAAGIFMQPATLF